MPFFVLINPFINLSDNKMILALNLYDLSNNLYDIGSCFFDLCCRFVIESINKSINFQQ